MKKTIIKRTWSREDKKAFHRNGVLSDHADNLIIVMVAVTGVKFIKGKLKFRSNTRDADFLTDATAMYDALLLNTDGWFTTAFTGMALFLTQKDAYALAITAAKFGGLSTGANKVAAKTALYGTVLTALAYVNDLARVNIVNAVAIIEAAECLVIGKRTSRKQDFAVKQGVESGEVVLTCLAMKLDGKYLKGTYYWQYSLDGGLTWISLPDTSIAKAIITGMAPGKPAKFRKRTRSTKTGLSVWCTAIDFTPL